MECAHLYPERKIGCRHGSFQKPLCHLVPSRGVFEGFPEKLLNAQEGKTKALRQWRFEKGDVIPDAIVLSYLKESIENCLAGKEVKPERKKGVSLPPILKVLFNKIRT